MKKPVVTFVLPGNNWSGGVRVTVLMGNLLLNRGHRVRIVRPKAEFSSGGNLRSLAARLKQVFAGRRESGWLQTFAGVTELYWDINEIAFEPGEIVIGVGTYVVPHLQKL